MSRNRIPFVLSCRLLCALAISGVAWNSTLHAQQEFRGRTLRDADYCFELRAENDRWQILNESRAQRTVPDSVAGLVAPMGRMSMVIVEPLPEGTLEDYRLLVRSSISELMTIEDERKIEYGGKQAFRIQFVGTISGAEFRFVRVLLLHKGFGYQIVAWGLSSDVGAQGEELQQLLDAFHMTPGDPRTRVNEFRVRDYEDVGIEVKDGIFRSAISGITLSPPDDWRLILGTELKQMNPDAEIGWAHEEGSVYGLVLAEAIEEASAEAYLQDLDRLTLEELQLAYGELTPEPSVTMNLFGTPVEFKVVTTEQLPRFRYYRAAVKRNGFAIRLLAWHFVGENQWTESLGSVIEKLKLTEGDELSQLRARLSVRPDPQTMIGPGFSLREGLYQFFPTGLQWKKPAGMWRVLTPEDAATVNPDGLMIASDVQRGIWGMVIAENIEGLNLNHEQYHALVMNGVYGEDHQLADQVQEARVDGQSFKIAMGDQQFDGMTFRYRVATTLQGRIAYQVLVWGLKTNPAVTIESMDVFWKNLRWADEALPATEEGVDGTYYDYRTGFSFKPPGFRWQLSEQMQPEISGMGNQVIWNRPGQFVMAVAIQPDSTATEPTALSDLANQFLANAYGELLQQEPEITEANLDGVVCEQRIWRGDRESVAAIVANRSKVTYFIVVFDATGKIDNLVDVVLQKFKFIGPEKVESSDPE